MPRQKSLVTVIRDIVRREIADAMQSLLNLTSASKRRRKKAKNGRRGKRRGPGRPPKRGS